MVAGHNKTFTHPSVQRGDVPYLRKAAALLFPTSFESTCLEVLFLHLQKHAVLFSNAVFSRDHVACCLLEFCLDQNSPHAPHTNLHAVEEFFRLYLFWDPRLSVGEVGGSPV